MLAVAHRLLEEAAQMMGEGVLGRIALAMHPRSRPDLSSTPACRTSFGASEGPALRPYVNLLLEGPRKALRLAARQVSRMISVRCLPCPGVLGPRLASVRVARAKVLGPGAPEAAQQTGRGAAARLAWRARCARAARRGHTHGGKAEQGGV